eukprot:350172-Chlamydomonas_euryale.AAC.7
MSSTGEPSTMSAPPRTTDPFETCGGRRNQPGMRRGDGRAGARRRRMCSGNKQQEREQVGGSCCSGSRSRGLMAAKTTSVSAAVAPTACLNVLAPGATKQDGLGIGKDGGMLAFDARGGATSRMKDYTTPVCSCHWRTWQRLAGRAGVEGCGVVSVGAWMLGSAVCNVHAWCTRCNVHAWCTRCNVHAWCTRCNVHAWCTRCNVHAWCTRCTLHAVQCFPRSACRTALPSSPPPPILPSKTKPSKKAHPGSKPTSSTRAVLSPMGTGRCGLRVASTPIFAPLSRGTAILECRPERSPWSVLTRSARSRCG